MSRILLQQALDALRRVGEYGDIYRHKNTEQSPYTQIYEAIDAINVELAKPEQEPKLTDAGADTNITRGLEPKGSGMVTLNQVGMRVDLKDATPRKPWVGLTDDEKTEIFMQAEFNDLTERQMYDVVEAKLKEKNNAHT